MIILIEVLGLLVVAVVLGLGAERAIRWLAKKVPDETK